MSQNFSPLWFEVRYPNIIFLKIRRSFDLFFFLILSQEVSSKFQHVIWAQKRHSPYLRKNLLLHLSPWKTIYFLSSAPSSVMSFARAQMMCTWAVRTGSLDEFFGKGGHLSLQDLRFPESDLSALKVEMLFLKSAKIFHPVPRNPPLLLANALPLKMDSVFYEANAEVALSWSYSSELQRRLFYGPTKTFQENQFCRLISEDPVQAHLT